MTTPALKKVEYIVVHCTGTAPEDDSVDALYLDRLHKGFGWTSIGYHLVALRNGVVQLGRKNDQVGNHTTGYDQVSLSICLVGGLHPTEAITRSGRTIRKAWPYYTKEQMDSARNMINSWLIDWPAAKVVGHNDLVPGKTCPGFDVKWWFNRGTIRPTIRMALPVGVKPTDTVAMPSYAPPSFSEEDEEQFSIDREEDGNAQGDID